VHWRDFLIEDDEGLRRILAEARTIAVLGAKTGSHEGTGSPVDPPVDPVALA
jgi:hypothetical protein